jgi:hypothetical protein
MKRYTIVIGNAVPKFNKYSFPRLDAYWEVENFTIENTPIYPIEVSRNFCFLSFAREVGLAKFFDCMFGSNSMTVKFVAMGIRKEDADLFTIILNDYLDSGYMINITSENFKILRWLEEWMQWAVKNCETPAIQVYPC